MRLGQIWQSDGSYKTAVGQPANVGHLAGPAERSLITAGLDTSTPSGRAMFQMLGMFAEFERAMIRERVMAGLSRAKADGIQLGRRRLEDTDADKVAAIVASCADGTAACADGDHGLRRQGPRPAPIPRGTSPAGRELPGRNKDVV